MIWKGPLCQEDALGFNLDPDDRDLMDAVQNEMISRPGKELIRPENPCHYDMLFCGYEKGKSIFICTLQLN